jgi:outer membrane protein
MKRLFCFIIVVAFAVLPTLSTSQSRIAFVDGSKLLKKMPETADVESRLQQLIDTWNREASDLQTELDRKRSEYDRKKLIMTDGERNAVEIDITELKKRLDAYRQGKYGTNGELFSQQASLMKPVYEKLLKAISDVATEEKYDYVFDRSDKSHTMLFSNAKFDLSIAVAKKLGLETNDIFSTPLLDKFNSGTNTNTNSGTPPQPPSDRRLPPETKVPPVTIEK